jgi:hypothetical protein
MAELSMTSFKRQIENDVWQATRLGLANYCNIKDNGESVVASVTQNNAIAIKFVKGHWHMDPDGTERWIDGVSSDEARALPPPPPSIAIDPPTADITPPAKAAAPPRYSSPQPEPWMWNVDKKRSWMA